MTGTKPFKCVVCDKTFATETARMDHLRAKHHEPSIAEQLLDAQLTRAMGGRIEDWEADMLS